LQGGALRKCAWEKGETFKREICEGRKGRPEENESRREKVDDMLNDFLRLSKGVNGFEKGGRG